MKSWKKRELNFKKKEIVKIAKKYNIGLLEATLLLRRKINEEDFLFFIEDSINLMHNPFLLKNINKFIYRIKEAIEENENVLVFGDKDADGITATIIMYETLKDFGLNVSYKIPSNGDFYGLSRDIIDEAFKNKITLIITVDSGISNTEEIIHAASKEIEVMVTDHHLPSDDLIETENIIINPHLKGDNYPFKSIAGCCVSFKVSLALYLSKTELYSKNIVFLYLEKTENEINLHALEINNYVLGKYLFLKNTDCVQIRAEKLVNFSKERFVVVFNQEEQKKLLNEFFEEKINIDVIDISEKFFKKYKKFKTKSLKNIMQITKYFQYKDLDIKNKLYYLFYNIIFEINKGSLKNCLKRLDLVTIGTIADSMPLKNENRIIIKEGLKTIALRERASINTLLKDTNLLTKSIINSTDIAYKIAPILNSTGRLEKANIALDFLLTDNIIAIEDKFKEIKKINNVRKQKEDEAWNLHTENIILKNEKLIICYDKNTPKGISSRIATRLATYYKKVAIFLTKQDDIIKGSIRSNNKVNSKELITMVPSNLIIKSGGHTAATGFTIFKSNIDKFIEEIKKAMDKITYIDTNEETHVIDAIIPNNFKKEALFKIIDSFEPYGHEFKDFVLMMQNVYLQELKTMDRNGVSKHLNMKIRTNNDCYKAIFFNGTKQIEEQGIKEGQILDIIFIISYSFLSSNNKILKIIDLKKT